jgi:O-antigen/teichoic acid export membrane protein
VAIIVFAYTKELLHLWGIDGETIVKVGFIIKILILGNLINGLTHIPYLMQLAHGWTSLAIRLNIGLTLVVIPTNLIIIPKFGIEGAAWVFVGHNLLYCALSAQFMYKNILKYEKWRWYWHDLIQPLGAGVILVGLIQFTIPHQENVLNQITLILITAFIVLVASSASASYIRPILIQIIKRVLC